MGQCVRTSDNRLAETWGRSLYSIMSFGVLNTAVGNQSTHCVHAKGFAEAVELNLTMADMICDHYCRGDGFSVVREGATTAAGAQT
jgi:hypothetical protein